MPVLYGLDGSRSGWISVGQDTETGAITWRRVRHLADLLSAEPRPEVVAIDVPIGLPQDGARSCDVEARKRVGPRRNSVFPAPLRPVLMAAAGDGADFKARIDGKRVSPHIWSIVPRILEVDELLRQDTSLQTVVQEMHPELTFTIMNAGVPMPHAKKSAEGREERRLLLRTHFGDSVDIAVGDWRRLRCAPDDILDAFAALWTAGRIHRGETLTIPTEPPIDAEGLRMEINA
jgi:predicted RNase H-like nuclease